MLHVETGHAASQDREKSPLLYNQMFSRQERTHLALDETIYDLRREKIKQIQALGHSAYPHKYEFTHSVPQILADHAQSTGEQLEQSRINVRVAGRIMSMRLMGKAAFVHLQQGGERLQCYIKKDAVGDKGFELFKLLDIDPGFTQIWQAQYGVDMNLQDLGRKAARALVDAIEGRPSSGIHLGEVRIAARDSTAIVELPPSGDASN
jgi:hypothetical protein